MSLGLAWKSPIGKLRILGQIEGVSFVALMGIGVPLKHLMAEPMGVRILGPIHGLLFVWLCVEIAQVVFAKRWPLSRGAAVFVASVLPFGPFFIEKWLRRCQVEFELAENSGS